MGQAQQGSGSPYSAYGLGDIIQGEQVSQLLMGGAGTALADPFSVIWVNPASYASLGAPSFEFGASHRYRQFEQSDKAALGTRTDLLGLSIGMPFNRYRWGIAMGLNPVTQVGYSITESNILPNGDKVDYTYSGNGGLNRAFIGLGRKIWLQRDSLGRGSHLSIGANFNYLFGNVSADRKAYYPRSGNYYNSAVESSTIMRSPMVNAGLQLSGALVGEDAAKARASSRREHLLAKDAQMAAEWSAKGNDPEKRKPVRLPKREPAALRYRIGLSAELPTNLKARRDELVYGFTRGATGVEFLTDTIRYSEGIDGTLSIPIMPSIGITLYNDFWTITLEHRVRDWEKLRVNAEGIDLGTQLGTVRSTILGTSYRPAGQANGTFFQNTIYRAGIRYTDDYLVISSQQLNEIGMAFGMSMPMMGSTTRSRFNIGVEFGQQGSSGEGLVLERYTTLLIGVTITPDIREKWLQKRRIE